MQQDVAAGIHIEVRPRDLLDNGGDGSDYLDGGDGNDTIRDSAFGQDTLIGGAGNDYLSAIWDFDPSYLDGGEGDDSLYGGFDNDTLDGGSGVNWLEGGQGDDVYIISSRDFYIGDTGGDDTALVSVDFAKIPTTIEHVVYVDGAKALPYWIDALIPNDAAYYRALLGATKTFNYTFPTSLPDYDDSLNDMYGFSAFNAQQKTFARQAMDYISTVIDVRFGETGTPDAKNTITFANNYQYESSGYSYYPDVDFIGSDIFVDASADNLAPSSGRYSSLVFMHELGHALGLKHPFSGAQANGGVDPGPYLPTFENFSYWTMMSYNAVSNDYRLRYGYLDIAALQYLYGPSKTARTVNDVYKIDQILSNFIWDGAGRDTLSAEGISRSVTLYLDPGNWGYVGAKTDHFVAPGQVTVNFGTVIENLIGGSGDDHLYGNGVDNVITGGVGDDSIDGGAGNDTSAYQGWKSQYLITKGADGVFTIQDMVDGRDGTDMLTNIEYVSFRDGAFPRTSAAPSFDLA